MIRTEGLVKRYGALAAVDGIDLDVQPGDVYGFLGANGSGKTTTVRCLLGLVLATSGEVSVLGQSMPRHAATVLPRVGALVEGPAAYGHLSGAANLTVLDASGPAPQGPLGGGRRGRRDRVAQALSLVGLSAVGGRPVRAYSLGMRQRWDWQVPSCGSPSCSSLTSPPTGLTPKASSRFGAFCRPSTPRAPRSSSPATCSPKSRSSAPASGCSTAAVWSSRRISPR